MSVKLHYLSVGFISNSELEQSIEQLPSFVFHRTKQNLDLNDELARSKRMLDEKYYEAGRLRDEAVSKGDQNNDQRAQLQDLEREIEGVKVQRAEMWRELTRLKEMNEARSAEASSQADKLKSLDFELARTQARIEDTQKLLDCRSADLRNKQLALEDTERELGRVREENSKLSTENAALRRDNERVAAENYDLRKEVDFQEGRNADVSVQIRDSEMRLKEKEDTLFAVRRDVESLRITSTQNRTDNGDLNAERDALEKHAQCL